MGATLIPRRTELPVPVPTGQGIFERGDRTFIQTPVQRIRPQQSEIEEYAFSKAVKQGAPNENIVWFKGSYVEADRANSNGAQWTARELTVKSLTPMLMPVTVMHDPRTAVGTIADTKLYTPEKDGVDRVKIDTVLALWAHRFPEAAREAEVNAEQGSLMQSMECYSPWYECSECGELFHKLPDGAERAMWCDHLKASKIPDDSMRAAAGDQTPNASRILGDVCFTGTGLIFGTRGAKGAYSEAHLQSWEDEVASFHSAAHFATETATATRSATDMGLVQIEQSELDLLRQERNTARDEAATAKQEAETAKQEKAEADSALEAAEAAKTKAETEKDEAVAAKTTLEEKAAQTTLKETRWDKLGEGFVAKLGDHTKAKLQTQAGELSDDDWESRLVEVEELTSVKRDADKEGATPPPPAADEAAAGQVFSLDEIASAHGITGGSGGADGVPTDAKRSQVVGSLAAAFKPSK
jgi:hypothetical protein